MHIDPEQRQDSVERRRVEQEQNIVRSLRSLPQEIRQPYDWTEFRRRGRERLAVKAQANRMYLAIAAALVLMIVGIAAWVRITRPGTPGPIDRDSLDAKNTGGVIESRSVLPPALADPGADGSVETVEARADIAERWLASLPSEPVVVHVGTRAAVAGLEDRIAQLDDVLSVARVEGAQPARLAVLEERRARLVNSLVEIRYAETLVSETR